MNFLCYITWHCDTNYALSCKTWQSSSDEEGNNGEKKKKGLKDKIKEKISGKKEDENTEHTEKTNGVGAEAMPSEEKGFIDKIKGKLPGQGQHKKAEDHGCCAGHCSVDDRKEKKGIFDQIKEKLPVGHNKNEEKPKEN